MAIGTYEAKSRAGAVAKPGVRGARRIDKQVCGRLACRGVPRCYEGLDVWRKAACDLTRHFQPFASFGAVRFADQQQERMARVRDELLQPNGAARSSQGAGVSDSISDSG